MRAEAYKLTGFTAVISALGFMTRWLQNIRIIDTETGLAVRGMGISALVVILIVLVGAALGVWVYLLGGAVEPKTPQEALGGKTFVHTAVCLVPAVILALSGVVQLFQATSENWSEGELGVRRICGLATLAAACAMALMAAASAKEDKEKSGRVGACLLLAFGAVWLIAVYKSAATDPVIWRFAIEVIGVCAALLAFFYASGYFFGVPNAKMTIFFCNFGAFLCIMTCIDEHTAGEALCLAGVALMLLIWGFTVTSNLRRISDLTPEELAGELAEAEKTRKAKAAGEKAAAPKGEISFEDFAAGEAAPPQDAAGVFAGAAEDKAAPAGDGSGGEPPADITAEEIIREITAEDFVKSEPAEEPDIGE